MQTSPLVDIIVGLIWAMALYMSLNSAEFVVRQLYIAALVFWGLTGLANLAFGVIMPGLGLHWLPSLYVVASIVAIITLRKVKKDSSPPPTPGQT